MPLVVHRELVEQFVGQFGFSVVEYEYVFCDVVFLGRGGHRVGYAPRSCRVFRAGQCFKLGFRAMAFP